MTDIDHLFDTIHSRDDTIELLRQQLDQTIEDCAKKLNAQGKQLAECQAKLEKYRGDRLGIRNDRKMERKLEMTDIDGKEAAEWKEPTIESLRQQLAECQAQVKTAKREALLEAIEILVADEAYNVEKGYGSNYWPAINALKQRAKELE